MSAPAILDDLSALADMTRDRLLLLVGVARADRVGALQCAAAAAVHGQPASEGAGRQRLADVAR